MSLSFSIVVCCYNSVSRISDTLAHLAQLDYPTDLLELIVVDNASKDNTASFAESKWMELGNPYTYQSLYEQQAGLIHARTKGIKAAKNDYIAFVDDDNWLAKDYLKEANQILRKNPSIGVLGGKITGTFETPPPKWMTPMKPFKSLIGNLAIHTETHQYGVLEGNDTYVFGAGSLYKRTILQELFAKNIIPLLSGRSKEALTSGDDAELCLLMRLAGYIIYRSRDLKMQHFITSNRLNWEYFHRLYFGFGYGDWIFQFYFHYLENGSHQSIESILKDTSTKSKMRKLNQCASLMSALPFGETFKKNKFHLLVSYEKGKLRFLEKEAEKIPHLQAKITSYCEQLALMRQDLI